MLIAHLLLLIFFPIAIKQEQQEGNNSFSVAVRCSARAMEMFVHFSEPFHGRLQTRPNGRCFVNGRGRLTVGFKLPLDEAHQRKCSIVRREQEFVAIVDLEMDPRLLTAGDNAYFVRCPTMGQSSSRGTTDSEGEREKQQHQGEEEEANNRRQTTSNDNASSIRQPVAEMQQLLAGHGEGEEADLLELSLANNGHGQQQGAANLRNCVAFSPTAGPDGKVQAFRLAGQPDRRGQQGSSGCQAQRRIHFRRPPEFAGGKFFVIQCEVFGKTEEGLPCPADDSNASSSPVQQQQPLHLLRLLAGVGNFSNNHSSSSSSSLSQQLEQHLLAALVGALFALGLALLCLGAVHLHARRRHRAAAEFGGGGRGSHLQHMGLGQLQQQQAAKRVQIVCPNSGAACCHSSSNNSQLSLASSALSFGPCPQLHSQLCQHPPPKLVSSHRPAPAPPECRSPFASSGPPSPASTTMTALPLSLDKLPEPPSLSLAEIRQLNLAFNGLSRAMDGAPPTACPGGVYSFAGIRLLNGSGNFGAEPNGAAEGDGGDEEREEKAKMADNFVHIIHQ